MSDFAIYKLEDGAYCYVYARSAESAIEHAIEVDYFDANCSVEAAEVAPHDLITVGGDTNDGHSHTHTAKVWVSVMSALTQPCPSIICQSEW